MTRQPGPPLKELRQFLKKNPISFIKYFSPTHNFEIFLPENNPSEYEKQISDMILSGLFHAIEKSVPKHSKTIAAPIFSYQTEDVSQFLVNSGKIEKTLSSYEKGKYAILPVPDINSSETPISSIMILKYPILNLLLSLKKVAPKTFANEEGFGYSVQKCFIPGNSSSPITSKKDFICAEDFPIDLVKPFLQPILKNCSDVNFYLGEKKQQKLIKISYSTLANTLTVFVASPEKNSAASILPPLYALGLYLVFLAIVVVSYLNQSFIVPINKFIWISRKVAKGELSSKLVIDSKDEFQQLSLSFNNMVDGLRKREKLSKFVSQDVLSAVKTDLEPGGELIEATIVFCTLKGFKEIYKKNSPKENFRVLSQFMTLASQAAKRNNGTVDKIIEDTIMIIFRKNDGDRNFLLNACNMSLEIANSLPTSEINFNCGIGLSTGMAVSGKIGSKSGKLDFTVIGNPVNLAARLKAETNRAQKTGILICPNSIRKLKGKGQLKFIDRVPIKGRSRTFPLYELTGIRR